MLVREAQMADAVAIGRVLVETWRAQYRGVVSDDYLDGLTVGAQARRWELRLSDPTSQAFAYVAETENGRVVGFAAGGAERNGDALYAGELYAIYIQPP